MSGRHLTAAELLRRYGGHARKRFGQNFLHQQDVLDRIVRLAEIQARDRVIEVGPGTGALTATILRHGAQVTAVELDRDLAAHLRDVFGDDVDFSLIEDNAQTMDWAHLCSKKPTRVVANLPYNVAVPILFRMIDQPNAPSRMVLMFQKEVAERLCAPVGTRAASWLTVAIRTRFHPRIGLRVKPGAFVPAPKVDSAVVVLDRRTVPLYSLHDEYCIRALAELGFSRRRKTLRNTLKPVISKEEIESTGIDSSRRAETLTLPEWHHLAEGLGVDVRRELVDNSRSTMGVLC